MNRGAGQAGVDIGADQQAGQEGGDAVGHPGQRLRPSLHQPSCHPGPPTCSRDADATRRAERMGRTTSRLWRATTP
jgi:hypothetical protein